MLQAKKERQKNKLIIKNMASKYQETERTKAENLIKNGIPVFYGGKAGKYFRTKTRDFVLLDSKSNIFAPIYNDVIQYFKNYIFRIKPVQ